eukprot:6469882-Heterocapsa_arctica.AAC.1
MGSPTTRAAVAPGKGMGGGWKAKVLMASQARQLTGSSTGSCPIGSDQGEQATARRRHQQREVPPEQDDPEAKGPEVYASQLDRNPDQRNTDS